MQKAGEHLNHIIQKFQKSNIDKDEIKNLDVVKNFLKSKNVFLNLKVNLSLLIALIAIFAGKDFIFTTKNLVSKKKQINKIIICMYTFEHLLLY